MIDVEIKGFLEKVSSRRHNKGQFLLPLFFHIVLLANGDFFPARLALVINYWVLQYQIGQIILLEKVSTKVCHFEKPEVKNGKLTTTNPGSDNILDKNSPRSYILVDSR